MSKPLPSLVARVAGAFWIALMSFVLLAGAVGCSCACGSKSPELSDLRITPDGVGINEKVTIEFALLNPGPDDATYRVELYVNDKLRDQYDRLYMAGPPGPSRFEISEGVPGEYGVSIRVVGGANTLSGKFVVRGATTPPITSPPTSGAASTTSPVPTTTSLPPPGPSPTASSTPSPTPTSVSTNLASWKAEAYDPLTDEYYYPASWSLSGDGETVTEIQNCQPAFFYSDFSVMTRSVHVKIKPLLGAEPDDDYIGFALGIMPEDYRNHSADFLLIDWKAAIAGESVTKDFVSSCGPGGTALVGLAVSRVRGIPNTDEFWQHTDQEVSCSPKGEGLTELGRGKTLGDKGWDFNTDYDFTFDLTETSLKVYVDRNLELDIKGTFKDGRLAFFNFSQAEVVYRISN